MDRKDWRPFIYGGTASIIAETGTFPIDTAKTRLQIQGQKIDANFTNLKYRGMIDAFIRIAKEEGIGTLYSGIRPAVLRQATYGSIKFGIYYTLKKLAADAGLLYDKKTGQEIVRSNILCAVIAGAFSSALANPTDVLKVRMQVHGKEKNGKGLWVSFKEIYEHEGIKGLWRGVGPTAQRAIVITAVDLPVYDFIKEQLMRTLGDDVINHFISSFIASLASAIASTPIDVIKTRLMNQRRLIQDKISTKTQIIYKGSIDCGIQTVRNEGIRALYKGFIPAWLRMGPWNIIFFITYEKLKKFY